MIIISLNDCGCNYVNIGGFNPATSAVSAVMQLVIATIHSHSGVEEVQLS